VTSNPFCAHLFVISPSMHPKSRSDDPDFIRSVIQVILISKGLVPQHEFEQALTRAKGLLT
jgi:hypothetical protein